MTIPLHAEWDAGARKSRAAGRAPLALLHGFAGDGTAWEPVRQGLAGLGPTLAIDLIGHGQSPAPEDPARYSLGSNLNDVEAVLRAECAAPAWVIGYSMGGRIALSLALEKPALLRGLILVSTTAGIETILEREARMQSDDRLAQSILDNGMEAFAEYWLNQPLFHSLWQMPEERFKAEHARRLKQRPEGLARSLRGVGAGAMPPLWKRLGEIDLPTLIVAGDEDERYVRLGTQLAMNIPGAEFARIQESGHAPHTEQPERFVQAIGRFLQRQNRAALAAAE